MRGGQVAGLAECRSAAQVVSACSLALPAFCKVLEKASKSARPRIAEKSSSESRRLALSGDLKKPAAGPLKLLDSRGASSAHSARH